MAEEEAMSDVLLDEAEERMNKSVESCRSELATVRTGRASPHLLDRVVVDYYGAETPLKQLANVAATDARLLTLTPFDKNSIGLIEKAIQESDLGLTPSNDGNVIRLQIPDLTEERRREMVKVVHGVGESGKISVRNVRRDVMHDLREMKKDGDIGEDDERRAESELQRLTDEAVKDIDSSLKAKEARDHGSVSGSGPALRRDHHRRQRPLGRARRAADPRRAQSRRRRRQGAPARRGSPRHRGAHRLLVLDGELAALPRGGLGPDGDVRRAHPLRDA